MKKLTKALSLSLAALLAVMLLVSCSSIDNVKSRFQNAGYTYVTTEESVNGLSSVTASLNEHQVKFTMHVFKLVEPGEFLGVLDITHYAVIIEFESDEALMQELAQTESATLKGIIQDAQASDHIEGNCLLIPITTSASRKTEMLNIFKGRM